MSIKKPTMIKPTMKKPVGPTKKPVAKKVIEEVKAPVEETPVEVSVEAQEPVAEKPTVEETAPVEEVVEVVEETVVEETVKEKEEKPKAKRTSKKKEKVKEEVKEENKEEVRDPNMSLTDAIDHMSDVANITCEEWEESKQEITDKIKALAIDADMDPGVMRTLIGEIDDTLSELRLLRVEADNKAKAVNEMVEFVRSTHAIGSNAEERKANGYRALHYYKKDENDTETINLTTYQLFMNNQLNFLNESIEILKDKKQLLITFSSMLKIEYKF
jgi:hypothetical protein